MNAHVKGVLFWAIVSRVLVVLLVVITTSIVQPYDSSGRKAYALEHPSAQLDTGIKHMLHGFGNWDGIYFARIALYGYEFEQFNAFFPLYPLLLRLLYWIASSVGLQIFLSPESLVLLCGFLVSNSAFVGAAVTLYRLGEKVLGSDKISLVYTATILFCFSPASIFFSALYTESLFAFFAFLGMLAVWNDMNWRASLYFAAASLTRSNGIVLVGFLIYRAWITILHSTKSLAKAKIFFALLGQLLLSLSPFIAFQLYGYLMFCPERPWCHSTLPLLYNFVQAHYWNVGFLKYWQVKQLPNFLLASPILLISLCATFDYLASDWRRLFRILIQGNESSKPSTSHWHNDRVLPFVVHLFVLTLTALFTMHVQVATRFLCSQCPPLYWYCAYLLNPTKQTSANLRGNTHLARRAIIVYFSAYVILGPLLFSSFYPWT